MNIDMETDLRTNSDRYMHMDMDMNIAWTQHRHLHIYVHQHGDLMKVSIITIIV